MKGIHLTQEEIEKYPLFYHGKSNEAEIREYNSQELLNNHALKCVESYKY